MPPQMARRCAGPAPSPPVVDPHPFQEGSTASDLDLPPHLARLEPKGASLEATLVLHIRRPMAVVRAALIEPQALGQWLSATARGAGEARVQLFGEPGDDASDKSRSEREPPVWVRLFGPTEGTAVLMTIALSEEQDMAETLVAWETRLASLAALVEPGASPLNDAGRCELRSSMKP